MASDEELLFGKIAIRQGFVTPPQLRRAVQEQEKSPFPRPLGAILVDQGVITLDQLGRILEVQQRNMEKPTGDQPPERRREDAIFGKLAVKRGHATQEQVHEALREQEQREIQGRSQRLGEVLVDLGHLKPAQVERVLEAQEKKILVCAGCQSRYNVAGYEPGRRFRCKNCGSELRVPDSVDHVGVDGEIENVDVAFTPSQQVSLTHAFSKSAVIGGKELQAILAGEVQVEDLGPAIPAGGPPGTGSEDVTAPVTPPRPGAARKVPAPSPPVQAAPETTEQQVTCAAWAAHGLLLVGTTSGCLLYDPARGQVERRLSIPRGKVASVSWDAESGRACVVSDGQGYLYDLTGDRVTARFGLDRAGRLGEAEGS